MSARAREHDPSTDVSELAHRAAATADRAAQIPPPAADVLLRIQRSAGNRAAARMVSGRARRPLIQRNPLLTACANATANHATNIDYVALMNPPAHLTETQRGDLMELRFAIAEAVTHVRRRQAIILALEQGNLAAEVNAWLNGESLGASLVGTHGGNVPWVRSSHAGGQVDPLLPQNPYDTTMAPGAPGVGGGPGGPPAAAVGPASTLSGRANWDWLAVSTTPHTTNVNPNAVASYFEITLSNTERLPGGRLVYDPFGNRWFLSEHYIAQYELLNVPPATNHQKYQDVLTFINQKRNPPHNWGPGDARWATFLQNVWLAMAEGKA